MALIYQSCMEMGADLSSELVVRQDTRVIYETFISDQSQRTNDRVLINAAAEFDFIISLTCYTHLNIPGSEA